MVAHVKAVAVQIEDALVFDCHFFVRRHANVQIFAETPRISRPKRKSNKISNICLIAKLVFKQEVN